MCAVFCLQNIARPEIVELAAKLLVVATDR
jgi:hypothetical protein